MKSPLSERVATALLLEMASGNYEPHMRFFSNRQIMKTWKVSCPIAIQTLRLLTEWKLLESRDRSGHYLMPDFRERALALVNRSASSPHPRQPQLQSRAFSLRENAIRNRVAVVLVSDEPVGAARYRKMPRGITCSAAMLTAKGIFDKTREQNLNIDFYIDHGEEEIRAHILHQITHTPGLLGTIIIRRILSAAVAPLASKLLQGGIPVVTTYDDCERTNMVSLNFNNLGIGYAAIQTLIEQGHRRIGVLRRREVQYFTDRLTGAQLAARELKAANVQVESIMVYDGEDVLAHPCRDLLSVDNPERITALFATDADSLSHLYPLIKKEGLRIPEDLSVIVCSSVPHVPPYEEPVDLMQLDFEEIGRSAFNALEKLVSGTSLDRYLLVNTRYRAFGSCTSP